MAFESGLLLLAIVIGGWLGTDLLGQLRPSLSAILWGLAATPPIILAMWLTRRATHASLRHLWAVVETRIAPQFRHATTSQLMLLSALAGLGEEALFRGVLQPALGGWLGTWPGLLVAAAVFGLAHFVTAAYALIACLFGIYLGWLKIASGSLLVPALVHALYDYWALAWLLRRFRGRSPTDPRVY